MSRRFRLTRTELIQLGLFLMVLLALIATVAWASYEFRNLRSAISELQVSQAPTEEVFTDRLQLKTLTNDVEFKKPTPVSAPAKVTTSSWVAPTQPEPEPETESPRPAPKPTVRTNPDTGRSECIFEGDLSWQPLEEC